jgi:hypothetical protein
MSDADVGNPMSKEDVACSKKSSSLLEAEELCSLLQGFARHVHDMRAHLAHTQRWELDSEESQLLRAALMDCGEELYLTKRVHENIAARFTPQLELSGLLSRHTYDTAIQPFRHSEGAAAGTGC